MSRDSVTGRASPVFNSYERYLGQVYFPTLDAVRAVAVIAVVGWHVDQSDALRWFHGGRGVTWFFALSGFLITTLSLREEARHGSLAVKPFYIRRSFRILPLYLLALVTYFIADVFVFRNTVLTQGWKDYWPFYLTFLQDIPIELGSGAPFQVAWSLAVEERFYLIWPLLGFVLLSRRTRLTATVSLALLLSLLVAFSSGGLISVLGDPLLTILLGCLAAVIMHHPRRYEWLRTHASLPLLALAILIALVPWPQAITTTAIYPIGYSVILAVSVAGLAMINVTNRTVPQWVLWIGVRSYAIYLFHTMAIRFVSKAVIRTPIKGELAGIVIFAIALGVSLVVAEGLHRTIEKPLIMRGRAVARARL